MLLKFLTMWAIIIPYPHKKPQKLESYSLMQKIKINNGAQSPIAKSTRLESPKTDP